MADEISTVEINKEGCPRCGKPGRGKLHEMIRCRGCGELVQLVPVKVTVERPSAAPARKRTPALLWPVRMIAWYFGTLLLGLAGTGRVGRWIFFVLGIGLFALFQMPIAVLENAVSPVAASYLGPPWRIAALPIAFLLSSLVAIRFGEQFVDRGDVWNGEE